MGTRGCKDPRYALAVANVVTAVRSTTLDRPARAKPTGKGRTKRMQEAFGAFRRYVGRTHPKEGEPAGW